MSINTASVAERRAKIEKLKKDKLLKELDRQQKEEEDKMKNTTMTASKDLIDKILRVSNQDLEMLNLPDKSKSNQSISHASTAQLKRGVTTAPSLKVSSMVVELEIAPKRKPETYTREVQCEIIDPKKLGKIAEEDEDDSDDFEKRMDRFGGINNQRNGGSVSGRRGSFATGIVETKRENAAPSTLARQDLPLTETEIKEMPKDEAKKIM